MQNAVDNGRSINSDLKLSQIRAIAAFRNKDCLSMKELANNIGVKLSNMTMMIDRLIQDEMAKRNRDESDRRKVMVSLTPKGKKIRAKFLAQRRKVAKSIFANLNNQDKNELLESLDKACHLLEKSIKH
jgi:DNA-binding MarR family transcriptional regulator